MEDVYTYIDDLHFSSTASVKPPVVHPQHSLSFKTEVKHVSALPKVELDAGVYLHPPPPPPSALRHTRSISTTCASPRHKRSTSIGCGASNTLNRDPELVVTRYDGVKIKNKDAWKIRDMRNQLLIDFENHRRLIHERDGTPCTEENKWEDWEKCKNWTIDGEILNEELKAAKIYLEESGENKLCFYQMKEDEEKSKLKAYKRRLKEVKKQHAEKQMKLYMTDVETFEIGCILGAIFIYQNDFKEMVKVFEEKVITKSLLDPMRIKLGMDVVRAAEELPKLIFEEYLKTEKMTLVPVSDGFIECFRSVDLLEREITKLNHLIRMTRVRRDVWWGES